MLGIAWKVHQPSTRYHTAPSLPRHIPTRRGRGKERRARSHLPQATSHARWSPIGSAQPTLCSLGPSASALFPTDVRQPPSKIARRPAKTASNKSGREEKPLENQMLYVAAGRASPHTHKPPSSLSAAAAEMGAAYKYFSCPRILPCMNSPPGWFFLFSFFYLFQFFPVLSSVTRHITRLVADLLLYS